MSSSGVEHEVKPATHHQGFSFFVAVCFTVNYIMGCGFLGVPEAFVKAGMVLGPILLILFSFICNVTKDFILEAMARIEAYTRVTEDRQPGGCDHTGVHGTPFLPGDFTVTDRKFELSDLTDRFLGRKWKVAYVFILSLYLYGALWAYSSVFAASMAANVPSPFNGGSTCDVESGNCSGPFHFYLLLFACLVVPMSCLDLEEQVFIQVTMAIARLVVVGLMVASIAGAVHCDGVAFTDMTPDTRFENSGSVVLSGLSVLIPVAVYSSIFHHSVPILSQPVADRTRLRSVFAAAFVTTCVFYTAIGLVIGLYFGEMVDSQCNLNWKYYVGCVDAELIRPNVTLAVDESAHLLGNSMPHYGHIHRPWWAVIVRFLVLIFPAMDVLSAYPLSAITLGNNTMVACVGDEPVYDETPEQAAAYASLSMCQKFGFSCCPRRSKTSPTGYASVGNADAPSDPVQLDGPESAQIAASKQRRFRYKVAFRLLAAVPPLIGASFESNLGKILQYTGLVGIMIAFLVPVILRYISIKRCKDLIRDYADGKPIVSAIVSGTSRGKESASLFSAPGPAEAPESPAMEEMKSPTSLGVGPHRRAGRSSYSDVNSSPATDALDTDSSVASLLDRSPVLGPRKGSVSSGIEAQLELVDTPYRTAAWSNVYWERGIGLVSVGLFFYVLIQVAQGKT